LLVQPPDAHLLGYLLEFSDGFSGFLVFAGLNGLVELLDHVVGIGLGDVLVDLLWRGDVGVIQPQILVGLDVGFLQVWQCLSA